MASTTQKTQTSPTDDAQTGSEPTVEVDGTEKVASGQRHVVKPGMNAIFGSPTSDALNPAYAPISEEEDANGVEALGLKDESQKTTESTKTTTSKTTSSK